MSTLAYGPDETDLWRDVPQAFIEKTMTAASGFEIPDFQMAQMRDAFPGLARMLESAHTWVDEVKPGIAEEKIAQMEKQLGVALPTSYKQFLRITRHVNLGGSFVIDSHPFFHEFPPFEKLPQRHQWPLVNSGHPWPPPSQGMLCFGDFWLDGDGDQVLFDVSNGLIDGEYPVYYYSHEDSPPSVRRLADSFQEWMSTLS